MPTPSSPTRTETRPTPPAAVSSEAASPSTGDRKRAALALASGVLFATTSPPTDFHAGVLLGLLGFALALGGERTQPSERTQSGAREGFLFGLGANLVALRFVPDVIVRFTPLPWIAGLAALVLLSAAQAIPWTLAGLLTRNIVRRVRAAPPFLAFAVGIFAATFVPAIFPWTPAGGVATWPLLVQTAEVVGERGTSLLLALSAGLAAHAVLLVRQAPGAPVTLRRGRASFALAVTIVCAMIAWGAARVDAIDEERAAAPTGRVALVQPGFDAGDRWNAQRATMMLDRLTHLTRAAEARGVDLTVWPESAYPYTLPHAQRTSPTDAKAVLQPGVEGPVLTGAYMSGAPGIGYNSAILATKDGALSAPYDKRHLLWFGETVPFGETFPWLERTFTKGARLRPGDESVLFTAGPIRAAVLNCYEDTLPTAGREAMEASPNLLVNITNDAWFVGSAEGELHLRLAVLRAIETRRDLVRAVNRGPTSFVDAAGRVRARYDLDVPGSLPVTAALLTRPPTFYARFGDAPLALLCVAALALGHVRARARTSRRDT